MKRLSLTYKGKTVISDSFNMKAYAAMHRTAKQGEIYLNTTMQGIIALFDGTELTADVIEHDWKEFDCEELERASNLICEWYSGVEIDASLQAPAGAGTGAEQLKIFAIYEYYFKHFNHLPSEIDRQDPQMLFDLMASNMKKTPKNEAEQMPELLPEHLQNIYKL